AQVALKKAEKQLALHDTPELQAQVAELRSAAEAAQKVLEAAQPAATKPASDEALKKAKIDAAMLRAQLRKAEKLEAPDAEQQAELERLRSQLAAAEKTLAALESQAPAPAARPAGDSTPNKAKTDAPTLRAQLR